MYWFERSIYTNFIVCRDQFYAFGEIMSIHMVTKCRYAFVTFSTRAATEKAADSTFNKLIVKGAYSVSVIIHPHPHTHTHPPTHKHTHTHTPTHTHTSPHTHTHMHTSLGGIIMALVYLLVCVCVCQGADSMCCGERPRPPPLWGSRVNRR